MIEKLQDEYGRYVGRSIFQYQKSSLDATVKREAFPLTRMAPAEVASMRGAFYAVTRRTAEAQRAIAEARQLDANAASSYLAEALLLDVPGWQAPAQAAYEKAIAHGTDDAYAYYRCALLSWPATGDKETWARLETWLAEAVRRNDRFAAAYAALARVRAALTAAADTSVPLALRAIALEPTVSGHRWSAAALYLTLGQFDKARAAAQNALNLARTSEEQRAATDLIASIDAARTTASANEATRSRGGRGGEAGHRGQRESHRMQRRRCGSLHGAHPVARVALRRKRCRRVRHAGLAVRTRARRHGRRDTGREVVSAVMRRRRAARLHGICADAGTGSRRSQGRTRRPGASRQGLCGILATGVHAGGCPARVASASDRSRPDPQPAGRRVQGRRYACVRSAEILAGAAMTGRSSRRYTPLDG